MEYSPKLKKAMQEIKAVIEKYDIAALVVLHTPGNSEYLLELSPTYSCAKFEGNNLRIRAKLVDDFKGDKKAHKQKLTDTSNMLSSLSETGGRTILSLMDVSDKLDKIIDAEHFGGGHTSHITQNN